MFKIRIPQASDYNEINHLFHSKENMHLADNDSIIEEDFYKESLSETTSKWFIIEKSGEVLAFIFFTIDTDSKGIKVKKFTINNTYRKKGLNEHLYKKLEQVASQNDLVYMQVEISPDYLDVIDFFTRKGWIKENNCYVKYIK
ncbi:GNAT family N-acetyltransferase [Virgibacillus necropolis]|nr:GNAT family N-acetyltransferase [Virgibacillus necropolis]